MTPPHRLSVRNHQRAHPVNLPLLRRAARSALLLLRPGHPCQVDVHLVPAARMQRLNEDFLGHAGPTDVITFDYTEPAARDALQGEIFICPDVALSQARAFRAPFQTELVRYVVHGLLHLHGYDDRRPAARRRMKQAENRLVRALQRGLGRPAAARGSRAPSHG